MSHATETDTVSAMKALQCAIASLDKGYPIAAEAWADTAALIIRESQITPAQQRQLVAPHDKPRLGDYVAGALSFGALCWFFVHGVWSVLHGVWGVL
ncbi:hypothetical protein UFOVP935_37 [uncultured Caudovirales phage]|uniref:Uncharacterized protein n=1 Tax=uncultured Caudovirales phage TaxID=2100421 RepID=A0A6J5PYW4_9CAUD|nr:hypothetical protein UFOVP935_37 [uncultured Caudovirales phage]